MISCFRIVITALSLLMSYGSTWGCPACYGDPDSPMTAGMNSAILVMLGITGFVLVSIVACFFLLWKRAKRHQAALSERLSVNEDGLLHENNEKGVVEWNNS